ncbi:MAG: hypothetical protein AAGI30_14575 [Planctomycetota bacterium]
MTATMQAVEFRCELRDAPLARLILRRSGARFVGTVEAEDTHFRVPDGLLKRRRGEGEPTDWVHYRRRPRIPPTMTMFDIYSDELGQARFGAGELPVWLAVRKHREIWLKNNLSIYMDQVDGLGSFVKLEMLVSRLTNVIRCHEEIAHMRTMLEHALGEPVSLGYAEMLARDLGVTADR